SRSAREGGGGRTGRVRRRGLSPHARRDVHADRHLHAGRPDGGDPPAAGSGSAPICGGSTGSGSGSGARTDPGPRTLLRCRLGVPMSNVVLNVSDVQKSFGGLRALSDINLQIESGRTHAIIGPNGAGKSTLLNVCVGRIVPDSGSVIFDGHVLTGKKPHQINQAGVARVFQTPEIFPDLTLLQNVMVPAFARRDG